MKKSTSTILIITLSIILLCIMFIPCLVSAENIEISSETGYSYIEWNWSVSKDVNIYIDGELKEENTSVQNYILSDLQTEEKHSIFLISSDTLDSGYSENYTTYKGLKAYTMFLFFFWFAFTAIGLLKKAWLVGAISSIFSILLFQDALDYVSEPYMLIAFGFIVIISFGLMFMEVSKDA